MSHFWSSRFVSFCSASIYDVMCFQISSTSSKVGEPPVTRNSWSYEYSLLFDANRNQKESHLIPRKYPSKG